MKGKRVCKKQLFLGVFCLVMVLVGVLSWGIRKSETPVRLKSVLDGGTVVLTNGKTVKLFGVSTMRSGSEDDRMAKQYLETLLDSRNIWFEYERGMVLMWVGCESSPRIWALRKMGENPVGCKKGVLVNEQLAKIGWLSK